MFLTGFLILARIASAGVIGDDGRRLPSPHEIQLVRALGHVFCTRVVDSVRRRSAGTATIVGNRSTILTAAHVFSDPAGPRGPEVRFDAATDCVFRQFDPDGEVTVEVEILHASLGAYRESSGAPNEDWAVLRTAQPLPDSATAIRFADGVSDFDSLAGLPIKILAFHLDVRESRRKPLLSEGKLLSIDYGGYPRLAHTADTGRMSSGAAIVQTVSPGEFVVVGINRSSANLGEFNLAVPLSLELAATLRSYAYGQVPAHRRWLAATRTRGRITGRTVTGTQY